MNAPSLLPAYDTYDSYDTAPPLQSHYIKPSYGRAGRLRLSGGADGADGAVQARSGASDDPPSRSGVSDKSPTRSGTSDKSPTRSGANDKSPTPSRASEKSPTPSFASGKSPTRGASNHSPPRSGSSRTGERESCAPPRTGERGQGAGGGRGSQAEWARGILAAADGGGGGGGGVLEALEVVRCGDVGPEVALASVGEIVEIVRGGEDVFAAIAALHVLAADERCRDKMLEAGALGRVTALVDGASEAASESGGDRAPKAGRTGPPVGVPLRTRLSTAVWDGAIRLLAKLVVFSPLACGEAIKTPTLAILAAVALPTEAIETRVRAAAGIASIASWSGPRFASEILETKNVITAMAGILTEDDAIISSKLRRATLDGLTVMAHRRRARVTLTQNGCGEFISMAARLASMSGDYDTAARSTVVAGQLSGRAVDEYGFLVEKVGDGSFVDKSVDGFDRTDSESGGPGGMVRGKTGLNLLQKDLLEEPGFVKGVDATGLEFVVDQGAGQASTGSSEELKDISGSGALKSAKSPYPESSMDGMSLTSPSHDPDYDRPVSITDVSPLYGFTSATERAVARNTSSPAGCDKTPLQKLADEENERIWGNVLKNRLDVLQREDGMSGRVRAYRELAVVPVPNKLRSVLWPMLLNVDDLRIRKPGLYEALCTHGKENQLQEDLEHTIEADLTRTMPSHCLFWRDGAAPGIDPLRRVLRAYAFHVPSVGYCQGMSSIAALVLLNSQSEEDAFLMLVRFMSWYGYKNVFKPGFPQYKEWVEEFRGVLAAQYPELSGKMESEGVIPELFLDKGIITCLTHNYPHRVLLRVWDLMLLGGSPKIVLKVCLAVLVMAEKRLMRMQFEDMVNFLQRGFADPKTGVVNDDKVEDFLDVARSLKLTAEPAQAAAKSGSNSPAQSGDRTQQQAAKKKKSVLSSCFPCFSREKED